MKSAIETASASSISSSSGKQNQTNISLDGTNTDDTNNPTLFIKRKKVNNTLKAMSYISSSFSIYKKREEFFDIDIPQQHKHPANDSYTGHKSNNDKKSKACIDIILLAKYWNSYFRTPFVLWVLWLTTGTVTPCVYVSIYAYMHLCILLDQWLYIKSIHIYIYIYYILSSYLYMLLSLLLYCIYYRYYILCDERRFRLGKRLLYGS